MIACLGLLASNALADRGVVLTCEYAAGDGTGLVRYHEESQPAFDTSVPGIRRQLDDLCRYTEQQARRRFRGWPYFTEVRTRTETSGFGAEGATCQYNAVVGRTGLVGTMEADYNLDNAMENYRLARNLAQARCLRKYPGTNCNFIECRPMNSFVIGGGRH
jgi:hypothetical protein